MKLQRQLSNGTWIDEKRTEYFISMVLEVEPRMAAFEKRQKLTTSSEVIAYLATGKQLRYDTDWYANIRNADAIKAKQSHEFKPVLCDCGHSTTNPMTASFGSSCPDCYDKMSE